MSNLGFWDDLDRNLLPLKLTLLELRLARITKMPSPNLLPNLIVVPKMLREPKTLVKPRAATLCLVALRNRRLVRLHRPVPPRQHRPNVFRRRRRRERSLEEPPRRRIRRRSRRRLLREQVVRRTRAVKREERRSLTCLRLGELLLLFF